MTALAFGGMPWGAAGFAMFAVLAIVLTLRVATENAPDEAEIAARRLEEAERLRRQAASEDRLYRTVGRIVWFVTFFGCWIYCIAAYGFLLGVGIGWLPSAIAATVAAFLWPLVAIAALIMALVMGLNW